MQRDVRPPPWLAQDVAWPSGKLLRAVLPDMDASLSSETTMQSISLRRRARPFLGRCSPTFALTAQRRSSTIANQQAGAE